MNAAEAIVTKMQSTPKPLEQLLDPNERLYTEIETLALLNKEYKALNVRYETLRESVVKQMKALKTKKMRTPANVVATLFTQLRTTLDPKLVKALLTPKQFKKVSKRSKVTTLKVTP